MTFLGNLAVAPERGVSLECVACQVSWIGCAAVCECPRCGLGADYWQNDLAPTFEARLWSGDEHEQ